MFTNFGGARSNVTSNSQNPFITTIKSTTLLKATLKNGGSGGQFTLSTQLMKTILKYLVIFPPTQHHSSFRSLPTLFICCLSLLPLTSCLSILYSTDFILEDRPQNDAKPELKKFTKDRGKNYVILMSIVRLSCSRS